MGSLKKAAKNFGGNRGRWDEAFKDDQFPIPSKATRVRLFNEVETVPTHWVEFYSKKQKGQTGFYALCINHDYDTGETVDNGCPYCKAGFRVSNYVYGYIISRREQRKGALSVKPIRLTPKCTNDILRLTDVAYPDEEWPDGWNEDEGPDATHPKFGFDITIAKITKNKKTEYEVHVADGGKVALKKSEFQAFKAYADQMPFAELAKAGLESKAEIERKLVELGINDGGSGGGSGKSTNYEDYDSIDDDDEGDDDGDDPVTAAPPKKKAKKKAAAKKKPKAKKVESLTDDDDEGDDRDLPWDDEDEEEDEDMETSYSDPDEEDAPEDDDEDYEDDED